MQSLWSQTTKLEKHKQLSNNIHVQNVIIGAGLAGILTAYFLKEKGIESIIIEADCIGGGQTKNTTAKITCQHGLLYHDLLNKTGKERAKAYAKANMEAIDTYEKTIQKEGIDCHFERLPSFLYSLEEEGKELLRKEAQATKELGIDAYFLEGSEIQELPFAVSGALCLKNQAQFHPLTFIQALTKELTIYENTNAISVHGHVVTTMEGNTITAENIIITTHYPFLNIPGFYFLRQHQERSYVLALESEEMQPPCKLSGMYYGIDNGGLSFRSAEGKLLLGGGSHRTGQKFCPCDQKGYSYLREQAHKYYPHAKEIANWSAQDCMPHDRIPFIGKYSIFRPFWYVATGFQKWGMTSSMIAAMLISDMICGKENTYESLFSPQRLLVRAGIKNLCIDIGESIMGLTKGLFGARKARCSHMECHLTWNPEEESYDCPCHGSRFDQNGNVIDNPAQTKKPRKH